MKEEKRAHFPEIFEEKFIRIHILVSGRVQGVFFRSNTKKKAQELKINGWVRNLKDERVEILAEGRKRAIESFVKWARKGPFIAKVDNLEIEQQKYAGEFDSFNIKY